LSDAQAGCRHIGASAWSCIRTNIVERRTRLELKRPSSSWAGRTSAFSQRLYAPIRVLAPVQAALVEAAAEAQAIGGVRLRREAAEGGGGIRGEVVNTEASIVKIEEESGQRRAPPKRSENGSGASGEPTLPHASHREAAALRGRLYFRRLLLMTAWTLEIAGKSVSGGSKDGVAVQAVRGIAAVKVVVAVREGNMRGQSGERGPRE
jgi:hypothetical protein